MPVAVVVVEIPEDLELAVQEDLVVEVPVAVSQL